MNKKSILITGGAGFIGSHLVRLMVKRYPNTQFVNLDALTYAGDTAKLQDIASLSNYHFVHGDITDTALVKNLFAEYEFEGVIHLAAESHVDQSIKQPLNFAQTNVMGTLTLLESARRAWEGITKTNCFITSLQMRSMEVWVMKENLRKPLPMILGLLTLPQRPLQTIL